MKRIRLYLYAALTLLLVTCQSESPIKQFRIDLFNEGFNSLGTASTFGSYLDSRILYRDFNVNNYPTATSIIFMAKISIGHSSHECIASLVSLEDTLTIEGSTLSTNSLEPVWMESANILDSFPEEDIDLTVFLIPSLGGVRAELDGAYLYIEMD